MAIPKKGDWENSNNGGGLTQDAWVSHNVGAGTWFIRSGGVIRLRG